MEASSGERSRRSDRLRRFWSGNNRIRLMLTLELAVMLPAAALIYLNFYQLKSLKREKVLESAIHSDFHQMLAIAEKQINHKAYATTEGIRDLFPSPDAEKGDKLLKLDRILSEHPELAHVFLYEADRGFLFRSQPQRMNDPYFLEEHQRLEKTFRGWFTFEAKTMLEGLHKRTRRISWFAERGKRADGYAYMTTAFFSLPQLSKSRVVIAGATFDAEYLKETFLPEMLDALIAYKLGEDGGNPLAMVVYMGDPDADAGGRSDARAREQAARRLGRVDRRKARGVAQLRRCLHRADARHQISGYERGGSRAKLGTAWVSHPWRASRSCWSAAFMC